LREVVIAFGIKEISKSSRVEEESSTAKTESRLHSLPNLVPHFVPHPPATDIITTLKTRKIQEKKDGQVSLFELLSAMRFASQSSPRDRKSLSLSSPLRFLR
jgi:hypothetical protein